MWTFWLPVILCVLISSSCTKKPTTEIKDNYHSKAFKFNLSRELKSFDPLLVRGINQRYLLFNLHRGLYYYNRDNLLTAYGAKKCTFSGSNTEIKCELSNKKYHNGKKIKAQDYVNTFNQIKALNEDSLVSIKNIKNLEAKGDKLLYFILKKPDDQFLHSLTNLNLTPRVEDKIYSNSDKLMNFSGPYYVKDETKTRLYLEKNKHYYKKPTVNNKSLLNDENIAKGKSFSKGSIPVVAVYIDDPSAALNLYNQNEIDFLRYLDTSLVQAYKSKVLLSPLAKLDGIFLNPDRLDVDLRKDLMSSLNFLELKKIFNSKGLPGCIPLTQRFFNQNPKPCLKFSTQNKKKYKDYDKKLTITIPSLKQPYHVVMAEWAQKQWEKHLGLKVDIEQIEIGQFYDKIKEKNKDQNKLSIYRKSLTLDNLTCKNAIETLKSQPEFKNTSFTAILDCSSFFKEVLKTHQWIPLGVVHIPHLHANDFKGYYINELDQFGLEDLKRK